MPDYFLIIEVDENQHKYYDCICENKRVMSLFQDIGFSKPMSIIRFNPDSYIDSKGKKITGCWSLNQKGILVINNQSNWIGRCNTLKTAIECQMNLTHEKEIDIIHLYYNGDH